MPEGFRVCVRTILFKLSPGGTTESTQHAVLGNFQPSPFDKLRGGSAGLIVGTC
jgi:hypothetical protein